MANTTSLVVHTDAAIQWLISCFLEADQLFRLEFTIAPGAAKISRMTWRSVSKKWYEDSLKMSLIIYIDHRQWTMHRLTWWHTINQATSSFETTWRASMEEKRRMWNNRDPCAPTTGQTMSWCRCGKICLSWTEFVSCQHTCTRQGLPPSWIFSRDAVPW